MGGVRNRGFTIVELLIVIVVIAILATITIVAYNGIQVRARDTQRSELVTNIKKALELYKIDHGQYPSATANPGVFGGWEASTDTAGTFMEYLKPYGLQSPTDPKNDSIYRILYYRYAPGGGSGGCDVSKGGFYVLRVVYENATNKPDGNSMAGECSAAQSGWNDQAGGTNYTFHSYENA